MTRIDEVDGVVPEETAGRRKIVRKHDPHKPSEQEREEHEMTHLPFRSWCRHCITGRGREEDCRKTTQEERQVSEIHLVGLLTKEQDERKKARKRDANNTNKRNRQPEWRKMHQLRVRISAATQLQRKNRAAVAAQRG